MGEKEERVLSDEQLAELWPRRADLGAELPKCRPAAASDAERERDKFREALEKIRDCSRSWAGAAWAYNRAGHIAIEALAQEEGEV